jgi:catabolite regulation protein CreA
MGDRYEGHVDQVVHQRDRPDVTGAAAASVSGSMSTVSLLTETTTWVAACSTPPTADRQVLVDAMIRNLMSSGVWSTLDWLLLFAAETAQAGLVNVRVPAKVATNISATAFAADRGYTGDGVADYIDLGEHIDAGGNWTQDSAALGVWCTQVGSTGLKVHAGDTAGSGVMKISARNNSGNEVFQVNDMSGSVFQGNPGTRSGHRSIGRTSSTNKQGYFNGAPVVDVAVTSTGLPTSNAFVLHAGTGFTTDQANAFWSGAGLDDAGHLAMDTILRTYLTAVGAV